VKSRVLVLVIGMCVWLLIGPETAQAQYGRRRYGPAVSAFGPVYNPSMSAEYRLWASNPEAYEQLMMQRQYQYEQKLQQNYQKQQQAFQKWLKSQKAKKDKGQPTDPAYDQIMKQQEMAAQAQLREATRPRGRAARRAASTKAATKSAANVEDQAATAKTKKKN
jgi:hypothetical protein